MFIEPTITWAPSGFSGYIGLDTKTVFTKYIFLPIHVVGGTISIYHHPFNLSPSILHKLLTNMSSATHISAPHTLYTNLLQPFPLTPAVIDQAVAYKLN